MKKNILNEVDKIFDEEVAFLKELVKHPSTRGNEQSAQHFLTQELIEKGFSKGSWKIDSWKIDINDIVNLPGFSPVIGNYEDAVNVVAYHKSKSSTGKSLILNGHIDVVPAGPKEMWDKPPYEPFTEGKWLYGRGSGDMKAGIAANFFALHALARLNYAPAADLYFQSVVEEECTGNGALACLQRGYKADAALIPEPFSESLVSSQVGVIWFQVQLKGLPAHALATSSGVNAIEAAFPLIDALHKLEKKWNNPALCHKNFCDIDHPLNMNLGQIKGGDWTSSVPSWCTFDVRMGIFPGQDIEKAKKEIEDTIITAANNDNFLKNNLPKIIYNGFIAEGYSLLDHKNENTKKSIEALENSHRTVSGCDMQKSPITATTDARFFGIYADTPALVYGPRAENIHGFNEKVDLDSLMRVTKTIALFIAEWCGLEHKGDCDA